MKNWCFIESGNRLEIYLKLSSIRKLSIKSNPENSALKVFHTLVSIYFDKYIDKKLTIGLKDSVTFS